MCFDLLNSFIKYFDNNQDQQQGDNHDYDEKKSCFGISHAENRQSENYKLHDQFPIFKADNRLTGAVQNADRDRTKNGHPENRNSASIS